jgi:hypothetical protein
MVKRRCGCSFSSLNFRLLFYSHRSILQLEPVSMDRLNHMQLTGLRLFVASILTFSWPLFTWLPRDRVAKRLRFEGSDSPMPPSAVDSYAELSRSALSSPSSSQQQQQQRRPTFNELYKVGKKLGTGAFSVAYEAQRRDNPAQKVAVKVTKKKSISADIERTIRSEIEIMQQLEHPNIVKYLTHYEEDNYWFVVLELLEGGEVFERIVKKSRYDEKEARDLVFILLGAVKYLHDRNIVHR